MGSLLHLSGGVGPAPEGSFKSTWLFRLLVNLFGYGTVFVPGYLIYKYVGLTKYVERSGGSWLSFMIKSCFGGPGDLLIGDNVPPGPASPVRSFRQEALLVMFCFVGLQGAYLTWGILQEKVMTQEYTNSKGEVGRFRDSQFLVFVNRILAFLLSGGYILLSRQPRHTMPLYKYAFCSFSNIMSSWSQYEALKFVSFPTQVLAKASKLIPVMLMGKLVSRQKYEFYEYITAVLITAGMIFFMYSTSPDKSETVTTLSGVILLICYISFDSFTSNWQDALFKQYNMSSVQMMCGVNLFSCLFTITSLLQQGAFWTSLNFMFQFPKFMVDCILLSISSGAGQLFIFYTISCFGPVVFVIIMTIRQGLAILLSCIIYQHSLPPLGIIGVLIVFAGVFLRIYCNQRLKAIRKRVYVMSASSSKV
ncbi:hypothetical protein AAG570_010945 [Ranatra chinensis]|uniref:Adenosine 3'-phospho 5'-phosphosulfate transporter 1 n=1 Tax=Ranatra chinensis TaxID=642074 RepID=A0ABD0YJC4_9HEMI